MNRNLLGSLRLQVSRGLATLRGCALAALLVGVLSGCHLVSEEYRHVYVYVGTYTTSTPAEGIYKYRLDTTTGKLTAEGLAAESLSPSFLALHPNRKFLYAVNEHSQAVSAFAIDSTTGELTFLNQFSSRGAAPCHLVVDRIGKNVLVANYSTGSVAVLPIAVDGRLQPATAHMVHTQRGEPKPKKGPKGSKAHSINVDPQNRFAFAADTGLDQIFVYRFDSEKGTLVENDPNGVVTPHDMGPRHFAFRPDGKFAYVINETGNTVIAYAYDAERGVLAEIQTVPTLPVGFDQNSWTSDVQVHPSGRFLYGANRGHHSIAVYAIDEENGTLELVEIEPVRGEFPRGFGIDPTGRFFFSCNRQSNQIVVFRIDQESGALEATGDVIDLPSPTAMQFLPIYD